MDVELDNIKDQFDKHREANDNVNDGDQVDDHNHPKNPINNQDLPHEANKEQLLHGDNNKDLHRINEMEVDPNLNNDQIGKPDVVNNGQLINNQDNNGQAEVQIPQLNPIPEQNHPAQVSHNQNNLGVFNNANDLKSELIYISEQIKDISKKQNSIPNEEEKYLKNTQIENVAGDSIEKIQNKEIPFHSIINHINMIILQKGYAKVKSNMKRKIMRLARFLLERKNV